MLLSIISLGGIVVLISILRLTVLLEFQKFTDFTYSLGKIIIISCIELEVAIMAANAPSLKIFFDGALRDSGVHSTPRDHQNNSASLERPRYGTTSSTCQITSKGGARTLGRQVSDPNSSQETLTKHDSPQGIMVTQSIACESHEARKSHRYEEEGFEMV